jgi:hypothetical protein
MSDRKLYAQKSLSLFSESITISDGSATNGIFLSENTITIANPTNIALNSPSITTNGVAFGSTVATYNVLTPNGVITANTSVPIVFSPTADPVTPQFSMQVGGTGFNLVTKGIYTLNWQINNISAASHFYIQQKLNGVQNNSFQWNSGATPLAGVEDSINVSYIFNNNVSGTQALTFLMVGSLDAGGNPTVGLAHLAIEFSPNAATTFLP